MFGNTQYRFSVARRRGATRKCYFLALLGSLRETEGGFVYCSSCSITALHVGRQKTGMICLGYPERSRWAESREDDRIPSQPNTLNLTSLATRPLDARNRLVLVPQAATAGRFPYSLPTQPASRVGMPFILWGDGQECGLKQLDPQCILYTRILPSVNSAGHIHAERGEVGSTPGSQVDPQQQSDDTGGAGSEPTSDAKSASNSPFAERAEVGRLRQGRCGAFA